MMPLKKIILLGPPEAGKTSIRRFFFEGIPAPELLENPEAASVGFRYNNYEYLFSYPIEKEGIIPEKFPIQLSLVDTAGQELEKWLTTMRERVFGETDIILFVFDVSIWFSNSKKEEIKSLLKRVEEVRGLTAPMASLNVIAHKYDKIIDTVTAPFTEIREEIQAELQKHLFHNKKYHYEFKVSLTSLMAEFRKESFFKFFNIVAGTVFGL
mgnify:CR=1 FL=1